MTRLLRQRITYANVVATLALFVALGGTATAAVVLSKNSVLSKHIKDDQVTTKDVKNASLLSGDFKAGQLFTQSQADGLYLAKGAKAADAAKLDGASSAQFLRGGGRIYRMTDESLAIGERVSVGTTDAGFVDFECRPSWSATDQVSLYNYWQAFKGVYRSGTGAPVYFNILDGGAAPTIQVSKAADQVTIQTKMMGTPSTTTVSSHNSSGTDGCVVYMQMITE